MTKQNVSVLWTEAVSIQVVPVNSVRCMSLINLGYTFEDMLLSDIHHLSDFQLMKFLASHPTARQCLGKEMEERDVGFAGHCRMGLFEARGLVQGCLKQPVWRAECL